MSGIETENNESYLDDEYEEVVLEESDEGKKKRSVWRVLRLVSLILCGLTAIAALVVFFVAKNAIRDGGYAETWAVEAHGEILEDRSYGERPQQVMDVYVPKGFNSSEMRGAVVFIHGGAFIAGDKRDVQFLLAADGINRGYAVVSVEYRKGFESKAPNALYDVRAAIRFLKAHAAELRLTGR